MMLLLPSKVGLGTLMLPLTLRSSVVLEVRVTLDFSTRITVSVSPTCEARWFSNKPVDTRAVE